MNDAPMKRISSAFEAGIVVALQFIMMFVIALAVVELVRLLLAAIAYQWFGIGSPLTQFVDIGSVDDLQRALQRAFGGVLLVLLGLELFDTLRTYFKEHRLRLEIILVVAIIAVGRHVILLDFEHLNGLMLIGIASLIVALTGGYFLVRRVSTTPAGDRH